MKKTVIRTLSLSLVLVMCLSVAVSAAGAPISVCASEYFDSYGSSIHRAGNGGVTVYFNVVGTNVMDKIGANAVFIYEKNGSSWDVVKVFWASSTPSMMGYNTIKKTGSVTYYGTSGKQYYASVSFYALKNGNGQIKDMSTITITA